MAMSRGTALAVAMPRQQIQPVNRGASGPNRLFRQSPALNEIGAGLNLSPNALMALRDLGVEDAVIALGSESDFLIIRSWKSGRVSACAEARSASNSARLT